MVDSLASSRKTFACTMSSRAPELTRPAVPASGRLQVQRAAAGALRTLAFKNEENKNMIVECTALPTLIQMLRSADMGIHYEAVGVIGNLVHSSQHIKKTVLQVRRRAPPNPLPLRISPRIVLRASRHETELRLTVSAWGTCVERTVLLAVLASFHSAHGCSNAPLVHQLSSWCFSHTARNTVLVPVSPVAAGRPQTSPHVQSRAADVSDSGLTAAPAVHW